MEPTSYAARLAKRSVESYVRDRVVLDPPADIFGELAKPAGVFVSLKSRGALRGCIGTIEPVQDNAACEIIYNAISAAVGDPRFPAVEEGELGLLDYSVDILGPAEDVDTADDLDPKRYGVIVEARGRKGLLLPDLEGVESVEDQISICLMKAGINREDDIRLKRFEVIRHH